MKSLYISEIKKTAFFFNHNTEPFLYLQKKILPQTNKNLPFILSISSVGYAFEQHFCPYLKTYGKKFLQFTTLEHTKTLLKENQATLFETAYETGLSGTARLHDLFINIEGMTLAAYKNSGKDLAINYSFAESTFGKILCPNQGVGF